jgi:acyl carrier protein
MPTSVPAADLVRAVIVASWAGRFQLAELHDDAELGEAGLGLDSVEAVELLLACEAETGVTLPESIFTGRALTIARLAACL